MGRRAGMTPKQFADVITRSGVSVETLKARIHADFVWQQIIRGKFAGSLQVGEKEVQVKLQSSQKQEPVGFEYRLRPVLFLAARGAADARKREAENLRARFQNCDEGLRLAMALPDVVLREALTRQSADLPQAQRDVLNNTQIGHLTPPDVTSQGVEMFAVCSKKEAAGTDTPGKREIRETMFQERFQQLSKKFLKELRSQAMIEMR
jgi:peptidyl-prolyl cis-trans isomerase SurA